MDIEILLIIMSFIGTIAFSVSGALIAIENKLDLFGVIILGAITACGGGAIRDIMLNKEIRMFAEPWYCFTSIGVAVIVFFILYFLKNLKWEDSRFYKVFYNITDSIGLGAFVVVGAQVAINSGVTSFFTVTFYAVLTAVGGGIIRDLMAMKIPAIFRKHIYAIAALIGACYFYVLNHLGANYTVNVLTTVVLIVIIRFLAFKFEWSLPKVQLKENNS